jgi:CheY-like chemotaxis protein
MTVAAVKTNRKKSILVIEDDQVTMILIECILAGMDYVVLKAETASDGIEIARQKRPDLILLDILLPGMSGLQVLQTLKKNLLTEAIPVIMMTSLSDKDMVTRCIQEQCNDYIVKPVTAKVLEEKVRRQIANQCKNPTGS